MLPSPHRLRRSADFTTVMRRGQQATRTTVVVHVFAPPLLVPTTVARTPSTVDSVAAIPLARGAVVPGSAVVPGAIEALVTAPARFGLVVGRAVGNSVVRHRVSRRLRALLAQRIDRVAAGADVVVRARPAAAAATSAELGVDLDSALATVNRRLGRAHCGRSR